MEEKQFLLSEEDFRQAQRILEGPAETTKLEKLFDAESPFGKPMSFGNLIPGAVSADETAQ